jgi:hypothetical protein
VVEFPGEVVVSVKFIVDHIPGAAARGRTSAGNLLEV